MKKENKMILKTRAKSSAEATMEMLKDVGAEDLITDGFVSVDSEIEQELIKRFEAILVKSCLDHDYLKPAAYNFFKDMAKWIKKNKIYREFLDFGYYLHNQLRLKNAPIEILSSYINLYLEVLAHLAGVGRMVYGLRTNGSLILKSEIYPPLDLELEESLRQGNLDGFMKKLRKLGYDVRDEYDLQVFIHNEQVVSNMVYVMASFIDENTEDIIPLQFHEPSDGFPKIPEAIPIGELKDALMLRRYTLPKEGVYVDVYNIEDISGILVKEILRNNQIYMLFRMDFEGKRSLYGIYDTRYRTFYSLFTESSADMTHGRSMESLMLDIYAHIVTDIHDTKPGVVIEFDDKIDAIGSSFMGIVTSYNDSSSSPGSTRSSRLFDKRKYKEETISINPFIRRLPEGAVASEEAVNRALKFGYQLQPGETFVRAFSRKSYTSKKEPR